jgi:sialic acid synthase SpsE
MKNNIKEIKTPVYRRSIQIGKIIIGENSPVLIIPEGCDNHHGSLARAKELTHSAKEAGAKIIKFQLHLPDEEMDKKLMAKTSAKMFKKWGDLYGFIKKNLLSVEAHAELIRYCRKIGIQYFCTPFSLKAAEILKEIGGDVAFKIGSGETEDLPMIEEVAKMKKPMIISTGMTTGEEINLTVRAVKKYKTPFSLAHCISAYPPKNETELHLGVISELKERYGVPVGFSDHTPPGGIKAKNGRLISEDEIIWGAIGQGACYVEKHFTLDRNAKDADSRFSHDGKTLKKLIQTAEAAKAAMNRERDVYDCEKGVWIWAKRSLFAVCDIPAGMKIKRAMLTSKRPGVGIRSKKYKEIIGKTAKNNIKKNQLIEWKDLK